MKKLSKPERNKVASQLLDWYGSNKRDLAWRRTHDPYKIWISEIMLQQTQVKTVEPYYERFLSAFPNVEALAGADLDNVLKLWEGLGYYSRARNLHKAAKIICTEHNGQLPKTRSELIKLPGIGKYVSAAVSSIAFDEDEVAIDGNVRRVFARLLGIKSDPKLPKIERELESELQKFLPSGEARQFNQAVMELGALICIPQNPNCGICPLNEICEANLKNLQHELPIRAPRKKRPHNEVAVGIIWKNDKILITKRPEEGLLGGLWEFPGGKQQGPESLEECLHREIEEEIGLRIAVDRALPAVDHGYTHFTVRLHPFECSWVSGDPETKQVTSWAWIEPHELDNYAFPRANQKIFQALFERELEF